MTIKNIKESLYYQHGSDKRIIDETLEMMGATGGTDMYICYGKSEYDKVRGKFVYLALGEKITLLSDGRYTDGWSVFLYA